MAKPNFNFQKRQREQAKERKKQEKEARKEQRRAEERAAAENADGIAGAESPPAPGNGPSGEAPQGS